MRFSIKKIILTTVFGGLFVFAAKAQSSYKAKAEKLAEQCSWIGFDVTTKMQKDDSVLWIRNEHIILHYDKERPAIFSEEYKDGRILASYLMDKEKYVWINYVNREITQYDNKGVFWDDYHSFGMMEYIQNTFHYLSYYLVPLRKTIRGGLMTYSLSNINAPQKSTTIEGTPYTQFTGWSKGWFSEDTKTGKKINVSFKSFFFVNDKTNIMDSVFVVQYPLDFENRKKFISIKNIDYNDKQYYIDSVFNLDNSKYISYSRHNSKNPPLSRSFSTNKSVNEALLNYHIDKLNGERTTIADNNGWLLLNFWTINCPPCVAHLQAMGVEKDSLGGYYLESKGIKILAINHRSDNVELIRSIAEKTNTTNIIYFAKGMGGVINIPSLGYYYLISPDKQIVYETSNLDDYSELLEAKANYEKQHKSK